MHWLPSKRRPHSWVYFIEVGAGGPVKIGIAGDADRRLASLQNSHYEELAFVAVIPGTEETEKAIHGYLATSRIRGEWFARTLEVNAVLDLVASCEGHFLGTGVWTLDPAVLYGEEAA